MREALPEYVDSRLRGNDGADVAGVIKVGGTPASVRTRRSQETRLVVPLASSARGKASPVLKSSLELGARYGPPGSGIVPPAMRAREGSAGCRTAG